MAKNPAFSFYAQDYLVDTFQWDRPAKSLHVDLMALSWINGYIEADDSGYPTGLSVEDKALWNARVKYKWELKDGKLTNSKIEESRKKKEVFLKRQSENGKLGGRKKPKLTQMEPRIKPDNTQKEAKTNPDGTQTIPRKKPLEEEKEKEYRIELIEVLMNTELPAASLEAVERNQVAFTKNKNTAYILSQWQIFLSERQAEPPERRMHYRHVSDLTSYFTNWMRNKFPKNADSKTTKSDSRSEGATQALNNAKGFTSTRRI